MNTRTTPTGPDTLQLGEGFAVTLSDVPTAKPRTGWTGQDWLAARATIRRLKLDIAASRQRHARRTETPGRRIMGRVCHPSRVVGQAWPGRTIELFDLRPIRHVR
jgi:hypothetical protein